MVLPLACLILQILLGQCFIDHCPVTWIFAWSLHHWKLISYYSCAPVSRAIEGYHLLGYEGWSLQLVHLLEHLANSSSWHIVQFSFPLTPSCYSYVLPWLGLVLLSSWIHPSLLKKIFTGWNKTPSTLPFININKKQLILFSLILHDNVSSCALDWPSLFGYHYGVLPFTLGLLYYLWCPCGPILAHDLSFQPYSWPPWMPSTFLALTSWALTILNFSRPKT